MSTTRKAERKIEADSEPKPPSGGRGDSPAMASGTKKRTIPVPKAAGPVMIQAAPVVDVKGLELPRPDESTRPTIRELAVEYLKHPDEWLDHPNPQFGGRTPNEMIAAGEEEKVYNLFYCYQYGMF